MKQNQSTKEQLNNLIEFRQGVYEYGLVGYRDAQFEIVDALLSNMRVQSYAELTLSPLFRRGWASGYAAVEEGQQCDGWTHLIDIAYWQLFLARQLVADRPLPWQMPQSSLTPGRVLQAMALLLATIGTPTQSVQTRGKSPGWPKGRKRSPPHRFKTVRRGRN